MKTKMAKEETIARIKRMEWVKSEMRRCIALGLPVSAVKEKGIQLCSFNGTKWWNCITKVAYDRN